MAKIFVGEINMKGKRERGFNNLLTSNKGRKIFEHWHITAFLLVAYDLVAVTIAYFLRCGYGLIAGSVIYPNTT